MDSNNTKKYKMIAMDMDYTLLGRDKKISEKNLKAISMARDKGIEIVVATGRVYASARIYARMIGITTPIIASNGAIIKKDGSDKIMYMSTLPDEAIAEMIRLSRKYGLYCHLYTKDTVFTEKIINISSKYIEWNKGLPEEDRIKIEVIEELEELITTQKGNILKAVVVDSDRSKILNIRNEIMATGIVSVTQSMSDNIEVMNKEVSKGNALKILAELYGIKREEIIAIGDNENDLSMIRYSGLGIAMGNADECLKKEAQHITDDCDENGVAKAIEKFILNS